MSTEWASLLEEADDHGEIISSEDNARQAANRVENTLNTEGVIDQWNNVNTDYRTAAEAFTTTYETLYETRHEAYSDSIDSVRAYAGSDVDKDELDSALSDLIERQGDASTDLSISDKSHINPNPSLTRLIEHIQTVDAYESAAKTEVDDIGGSDDGGGKVRESVNTDDIFGNIVVTNPSDIETPINELREEVEELLNQDGDVEIRFR